MSNFAKMAVFIWIICGMANAIVMSAKAEQCDGSELLMSVVGAVAGPPLTIAVLMNGPISKGCPKESP